MNPESLTPETMEKQTTQETNERWMKLDKDYMWLRGEEIGLRDVSEVKLTGSAIRGKSKS